MTALEFVAITGALCGAAMVLGGIWLLAKGVITLAATPKSEALTMEWRKQFRIKTQVPAVGIFIIGLFFVVIPLRYLQINAAADADAAKAAAAAAIATANAAKTTILPIEIAGELKGIDQKWQLSIRPQGSWEQTGESPREFSQTIYPKMSSLVLQVTSPGFLPFEKSIPISAETPPVKNIGTVELLRTVSKTDIKQEKPKVIPFNIPTDKPAFGTAQ